jgi:hypothetical protein
MGAIKRFLMDVSYILEEDGNINPRVVRVAELSMKACEQAKIERGRHDSDNPEFVRIVKEVAKEVSKCTS